MKSKLVGGVAAVVIMAVSAYPGTLHAETTSFRVTPAKKGDHLLVFDVRVEAQMDASERLWQVDVTVKPARGKEFPSPRKVGTLQLKNGKALIAEAELAPTVKDGAITYSFRVAAKSADQAGFIFGNTLDGNPDLLNQGHFCWFQLADFLPREAEDKRP